MTVLADIIQALYNRRSSTQPDSDLFSTISSYAAIPAESGIAITNFTYPPFYVERYGADPTGVSDSGVAFRSACSVAKAAGGGKIFALGKLYNFTTWDTVSFESTNNLALFCIPGNTELTGAGMFYTKLRISQTARTGMYSGGANATHIIGMRAGEIGQYVHDIQFDWNGIVQAASNDICYDLRSMDGGCIIERVYGTQAPITNALVFGSNTSVNPVRVSGCVFSDSGPNMSGNSGINTDLSYIYCQSINSIFENNRIFNTSIANNNCGGMEMHCSGYTVKGNFVKNCWPGFYLGVEDSVTISKESILDGNYIGFCNSGLELIDRHNGLRIINNYFEANVDQFGSGFGRAFVDIFSPLNASNGSNFAGIQTGLIISGNVFDSSLNRQGTLATSAISINLSCLLGAKISDNVWISPLVAVNIAGSTTAANIDIQIENNLLINANDPGSNIGYFETLGDSSAGWASGSIYTDVYIRWNKILRNRGSSLALSQGLVSTGGGPHSAVYTNVRYEYNDTVNITDGILLTGAATISNGVQSPAFSSPIAIDAAAGLDVIINASTGSAFTISSPTNGSAGTLPRANDQLTITIKNTSGGALGAVTWGAAYKMASWTSPANGSQRSITFIWNFAAGFWYEISRTPADVPN